jgi:hypothetical protein
MANDGLAEFESVAAGLSKAGGKTGKMFGMPSVFVGGKAFAGYREGSMIFKLGGDAHARALALAGAELFDPMGGRPMKEWVVVPQKHAAAWPEIGKQALDYVASGGKKA